MAHDTSLPSDPDGKVLPQHRGLVEPWFLFVYVALHAHRGRSVQGTAVVSVCSGKHWKAALVCFTPLFMLFQVFSSGALAGACFLLL